MWVIIFCPGVQLRGRGYSQEVQAIPADIIAEDRNSFSAGATEVIPATSSLKKIPMAIKCPPGVHFQPTDQELIKDCLEKRINNEPIPIPGITEANLYGRENPHTLAERYPPLEENEWYFFTPRERKYPNGSRPKRAAGTGYWKATGKDKDIYLNGQLIGKKKMLVFFEGKPPLGVKTSWSMQEFTVNQPPRNRSADDMRLDEWVLCRISKKKASKSNKNQQEDQDIGSVDNEEIDIPVVDNNVHSLPAIEFEDNVAIADAPILSNNNDILAFPIDVDPPDIEFPDDVDTTMVENNLDCIAAIENPDGLINSTGNRHQPAFLDVHPHQVPYISVEGSSSTLFGLDSGNNLQTGYHCGMANPFGQPQNVLGPFLGEQLQPGFNWRIENTGIPDQFSSYIGPSTDTYFGSFANTGDGVNNDNLQIPNNNNQLVLGK